MSAVERSAAYQRWEVGMTSTFIFPGSADLLAWSTRIGSQSLDPREATAAARKVRRGSWIFTTSVLAPSILSIFVGLALQPASDRLAARDFWVLFGLLAVIVVVVTMSWRTIAGFFRPDVAVCYYAAACINSLRQSDGGREKMRYLSVILPELERQLVSPQLNVRNAGTAVARGAVADRQQRLAAMIGEAEEAWRRRPEAAENAAFVLVLGEALAVVALGRWFDDRLQVLPHEGEAHTAAWKSRRIALLPRLATELVSKGTELAVGSLGSLALLVVAAAQRS